MDDNDIYKEEDDFYATMNLPKTVSIHCTVLSSDSLRLPVVIFLFRNSNENFFFSPQFKATLEQINTAYKQFSRIYHPDKHTDPDKKKDAELLFNRIKQVSFCFKFLH